MVFVIHYRVYSPARIHVFGITCSTRVDFVRYWSTVRAALEPSSGGISIFSGLRRDSTRSTKLFRSYWASDNSCVFKEIHWFPTPATVFRDHRFCARSKPAQWSAKCLGRRNVVSAVNVHGKIFFFSIDLAIYSFRSDSTVLHYSQWLLRSNRDCANVILLRFRRNMYSWKIHTRQYIPYVVFFVIHSCIDNDESLVFFDVNSHLFCHKYEQQALRKKHLVINYHGIVEKRVGMVLLLRPNPIFGICTLDILFHAVAIFFLCVIFFFFNIDENQMQ